MPVFGSPQSEWKINDECISIGNQTDCELNNCYWYNEVQCIKGFGWPRMTIQGTLFQMGPINGYARSITANLRMRDGLQWTKCGIYDENGDFVGETVSQQVGNYSYEPTTFEMKGTPTLLAGQYYYLVCWCGQGASEARFGVTYSTPEYGYHSMPIGYVGEDPPMPARYDNFEWVFNHKADIFCTYDEGEPPNCPEYQTQSTCENVGCYWYNGACHSLPPTCDQINNQADCEANDCYWCNGVCQSSPCDIVCSDYLTQLECEAVGCYWWSNGTCNSTSEQQQDEFPWLLVVGVVGGIATIGIIGLLLRKKR
jgi:hypothetical protein